MSADPTSNVELLKMSLLTQTRLRWLIKKLQEKKIISDAEFQEIWNSWDEEEEDKEQKRTEAAGVK